jgi:uncharacterized protein YqhQ
VRAPGAVATGRRPDRTIAVRRRAFRSLAERSRVFRLPIFRGAVALIESLALGMGALLYSAEEASGEPVEENQAKRKWTMGLVLAGSLLAGIGFFFYLPLLITEWTGVRGGFAFNLVDGVIRLAFLSPM